MLIDGWKYYNHAAIPTCAPHEEPNLEPLESGDIWRIENKVPLFARWTTNFDCKRQTNWWYVICEKPYSLELLKSKSTRKNIKKALKYSYVKNIKPYSLEKELYECYCAAYSRYKKADNKKTKAEFMKTYEEDQLNNIKYWACFEKETDKLVGYITIEEHEDYVNTLQAKFWPEYMKLKISDGIYHTLLDYYLNQKHKKYINAGERTINHITNTQDYKEHSFGYRKAYCTINLKYRPIVKFLINIIYPLRKCFYKCDKTTLFHQVSGVLKMEEIYRNQNL